MHTFLKLLKAFEGDLELVGSVESRRVVLDLDAQELHD